MSSGGPEGPGPVLPRPPPLAAPGGTQGSKSRPQSRAPEASVVFAPNAPNYFILCFKQNKTNPQTHLNRPLLAEVGISVRRRSEWSEF